MADDYLERIARFLSENGVSDYEIHYRSKHRAVVGNHGGRPFCVIFPSTGSDSFRGPANTVRNLRHVLGLVGKQEPRAPVSRSPKKPRPHRRDIGQHHSARAIESVAVAQPDRFFAPLLEIKRRLLAANGADANHDAS